ncbi:hypothetical protein JDV02_003774 [Purpureocillium takamizusanense]|uniref:Uncharacterized protein n=1 Tax=Purpureocillium takamizusanense TaxID=2060973 RepID=A0A9Q8QEH3_9HYPO|nr:uncharacterized protein JDV02_003774 [Purpureocillium takamizusanense]UNI17431.1 hypothetical protein JDV02_003774 [Purpureocillium takamizusanense]
MWTRGVPRSIMAVSASPSRAFVRLGVDDAIDTDVVWLKRLRAFPQELLDQIYGMCHESCLWRYFSALGRFPLMEPLLDRDREATLLSLGELGSWNRWDGMTTSPSKASELLVRLCLDELGVVSVERVSADDDDTASPQHGGTGYIVERVDTMKGYTCAVKGPFMRLIPSDGSAPLNTRIKIWDSPHPPPAQHITWFSERFSTPRVRCVSLHGLRGLTVFCSQGAVYAIHPHYTWGISAAPAPSQANLHPSERKKLTALFLPLSDNESIAEVWVRDCTCAATSVCRKTTHNEALAIITSTGRFQLFGRYISPRSAVGNPHRGLRWKQIGDATTTHLLYTDTRFQSSPPRADLGAASAMGQAQGSWKKKQQQQQPSTTPLPPAALVKCRGWAIAAHFGYMSVASLRGVNQLKLLHMRASTTPYVQNNNRPCRGMVLGYEDGSLAALGDCSEERGTGDVEGDIYHDPLALYHRIDKAGGYEVVRSWSLTDSKEPDLDYEYEWDEIPMEGELYWWFDDHRTLYIRHQP